MIIKTISVLSMLAVAGMTSAQVHVYVEQNVDGNVDNVEKVERLGTAVFGTQYTTPTVRFVNNKAVMTIGNTTVASVPISNGGVMVVDCCTFDEDLGEHAKLNKISKTPSAKTPYVTLYSPFQVEVPGDCEVYAPEYNAATEMLRLTPGNRLPEGTVVPAETPLVVKGNATVDFNFSVNHATCAPRNSLSGTSLRIPTPSDGTIYTFGHDKTDPSIFGLFRYVAATLPPGVAYLKTDATQTAKYIPMTYDDSDTDAIRQPNQQIAQHTVGKAIENGRVVIYRNGKRYNINGQTIK